MVLRRNVMGQRIGEGKGQTGVGHQGSGEKEWEDWVTGCLELCPERLLCGFLDQFLGVSSLSLLMTFQCRGK